jgi:hypothetical protein
VLRLSKKKEIKKKKDSEVKTSEKQEEKTSTPTERDHYVYESIIAEIGY